MVCPPESIAECHAHVDISKQCKRGVDSVHSELTRCRVWGVQNLQTAAVKGIADRATRLRAMLDDSAAPAPLVTLSTACTAARTCYHLLPSTLRVAVSRAVAPPQYDTKCRAVSESVPYSGAALAQLTASQAIATLAKSSHASLECLWHSLGAQ